MTAPFPRKIRTAPTQPGKSGMPGSLPTQLCRTAKAHPQPGSTPEPWRRQPRPQTWQDLDSPRHRGVRHPQTMSHSGLSRHTEGGAGKALETLRPASPAGDSTTRPGAETSSSAYSGGQPGPRLSRPGGLAGSLLHLQRQVTALSRRRRPARSGPSQRTALSCPAG